MYHGFHIKSASGFTMFPHVVHFYNAMQDALRFHMELQKAMFPHRLLVSTWNYVCTGNESLASIVFSMAGMLDDLLSEVSTPLMFSNISPSIPCFL